MVPMLYVVRMDVEPEYLAEFVRWYDTRHAPDLIGSGFHSCSAYHSRVGAPLICNVYEVPDLAVFSSDAYVQVRKDDRQLTEEVLTKISNHSNTTYTQDTLVGVPAVAQGPGVRPSRAAAVCAPAISTVRFELPETALGALRRWFTEVETRAQQRNPGFLRARLARQTGKHPLFPSRQPEWLVLTEWASVSEASADGTAAEVCARYRREFATGVDRLEYNVATLSATLLNADSWTA